MIVKLGHRVRRKGGDILESVEHATNVVCARFVAMEDNLVSGVRILKDVSKDRERQGDS
jgi:hypothetical protein